MKDGITVTRGDIRRLNPPECLNDNIIDMQARYFLNVGIPEDVKAQVHMYSTLFLPKLLGDKEDYSRNAGWAKNVDLFLKHLIFFPINHAVHWSLITIVSPENLISRAVKKALLLEQENADFLGTSTYNDFNLISVDEDVQYSCVLFTDSLGCHDINEFSRIILRLDNMICGCILYCS